MGIINLKLQQLESAGQMVFRERDGSSKRAYSRISLRKRKMLVKMVLEQGCTIAKAIKLLRIKLTTARLILQKYKDTGAFPMRKFKKIGKMMLDLPSPAVLPATPSPQPAAPHPDPLPSVKSEEQWQQKCKLQPGVSETGLVWPFYSWPCVLQYYY